MTDTGRQALVLAKEATNGWACHAKTKREHDAIARLHTAIDALTASAPSVPVGEARLRAGLIYQSGTSARADNARLSIERTTIGFRVALDDDCDGTRDIYLDDAEAEALRLALLDAPVPAPEVTQEQIEALSQAVNDAVTTWTKTRSDQRDRIDVIRTAALALFRPQASRAEGREP